MKIDEIKGKEVIDGEGNKIGVVQDVDLNLRSRTIEGLVLREGGLGSKIGMGEERIIPCNMIDKIGEKVLLRRGKMSIHDLDVITGGE